MSLLSVLWGDKSYIDIVKEFIEKIFVSEAKKLNLPKSVRYLVITGGLGGDSEGDDDAAPRNEYGADGYLRKPFNRKDLLHALEKISELAPVSD